MFQFKYNIFTVVSTFLLIITAMPFFLLGNTGLVYLASTSIYLLFFFAYLILNPPIINNYKKNLILISFLLFIYLALPFRLNDVFLVVNLWLLIFITFLLIKDDDIIKIVNCFFDVFYLICLGALVVITLKIIGVDLPRWEFHPGGTDIKKSVYYIYPGTAELIFQNYEIFGRSLFRVSGIFSEPGHFGVICAAVLFINPALFSKKKRNVILIAGLLSLSMGFYVMLLAALIIKSKISFKHILITIVLISIVVVLLKVLPEEFIFRFFGNKLSSNGDILDERTSMEFSNFYSKLEYTEYWFFGAGSEALTENKVTASDYRAFILKYGVIGIGIFLVWLFKLQTISLKNRGSILAIVFFFFVLIHRSWLVNYLVFYFMIYAINISYWIKKGDKI